MKLFCNLKPQWEDFGFHPDPTWKCQPPATAAAEGFQLFQHQIKLSLSTWLLFFPFLLIFIFKQTVEVFAYLEENSAVLLLLR